MINHKINLFFIKLCNNKTKIKQLQHICLFPYKLAHFTLNTIPFCKMKTKKIYNTSLTRFFSTTFKKEKLFPKLWIMYELHAIEKFQFIFSFTKPVFI